VQEMAVLVPTYFNTSQYGVLVHQGAHSGVLEDYTISTIQVTARDIIHK
jgi:hypothetical protein